MANVYLETSFFSACVTTRASDKVRGWRASSLEWWEKQRKFHELFISPEVIRELSAPGFQDADRAMEMLHDLNLLEQTPEVAAFAELLVRERVMPGPAIEGDAVHLAVATIHRMGFVLTWNVKHLANPNKRTHMAVICMRLNLAPPQIVTPDLLQESNDE